MRNEYWDDCGDKPYWERKTLAEMTPEEWELLCDGCGKCCLCKYQDRDTGNIVNTNISCQLLDLETCRCQYYDNRQQIISNCIQLHPQNILQLDWLPETCAYRLVALGKGLYRWHHLRCGSRERVHKLGISVRGRAVSESRIPPLRIDDHIVDWH